MTTPRDDDRELDRLLDDDGGAIGGLYRRLARLEPPRRLDRAVLGEAARAVRGRPPQRHRWIVGLGSAAGLVLAAGVAWHVGQDALQRQSQDSARRGMIVVPVEPITEGPRKRAQADDEPSAAAVTLPPPPAQITGKPSAQRGAAPHPASKPQAAAAKAATPAPPKTTPAVQPTPFPATTPLREQTAQPAGATAPRSDQDMAAKSIRAEGAPDHAAPRRTRSFAPPAPTSSIELRRDMQLPPDEWLARIRDLLQQDRRQQATESLRLFQRMHPDRSLPADLRVLLD